MIQLVEKSLDNLNLGLFITNDEPAYKIASFLMKLTSMGYVSNNDVNHDVYLQQEQIHGSRIKFYKIGPRRVFHSQNFIDYSIPNSNTSLKYNILRHGVSISMNKTLDRYDNNVHLYTKHLDVNSLILPKLSATSEIRPYVFEETNKEEEKQKNENSLDNNIRYIQFFEFNWSKITTLAAISYLCQKTNSLNIPLRTFAKLHKYIDAISTFKEVNKDARKKLIDLCTIFKNNKTINKLTNGILTLEKSSYDSLKYLTITVAGIKIIHENNFHKFNYLDHPAINFLTNFLEISNTFPLLEANISKEILTGI